MKTVTSIFIFLLSVSFGMSQDGNVIFTPLEIVNKRMETYNQHNFVDFIKLYANDVEIYTYPDKLLGIGTENISSIFKPKFETKSIQVKIVNQMNNGSHVINHEIVTEDGIEIKYISIYKAIPNNIISAAYIFIYSFLFFVDPDCYREPRDIYGYHCVFQLD